MRKGYDPRLVFSKTGNLIAISTGSDACTEHECGSQPLMSLLCDQIATDAAVVAELKAGQRFVHLGAHPSEGEREFPCLLEQKRITKTPKELRLILLDSAEAEAILTCSRQEVDFSHRELSFPSGFNTHSDPNLAGAWDERGFALRVRGKKYVKALQGFYEAMLAQKVVFAGSFFNREGAHLSGVILANTQFFGQDDKAAIKAAQLEYESNLRLKALDDTAALRKEMQALSGSDSYFGYFWPIWSGADQTQIVYGLNPDYAANAQHLGPYTREQLLAWASAKCAYRLTKESPSAKVTQ